MRTIHFAAVLSLGLCVSMSAGAVTEIIESSTNGPTHIDPINMTTSINYRTNFQYTQPKVTFARCPRNDQGQIVNNYFILKKKDESGVVKNTSMVRAGLTCDEIKRNDNTIVDCEPHTALEMTIDDPDDCKQGRCTTLATPRVATLPINLQNAALQQELQTCSPTHQFIIIRDRSTNKGVVASLSDKAHCRLERRRVQMEDAPWDDGSSPLTRIYTSNRSGFYIGDHTHYYFDHAKKEWCAHFRPDLGSTAPVCNLNNMTRSIAFAIPAEDNKHVQKGAIKLTVDANGKPVAYIGHPKSAEYSRTPELDESKPLMRISVTNTEQQGRRVTFDAMSALNGSTLRSMTVAPTFTMGSNVGQPGTCDATACLDAVSEVLTPDATSALQCKNTMDQALAVPGSGRDLCYSCSGVSSGACGTENVVLTKANISQYVEKISACRGNTAPIDQETTINPVVQ